MGIEEVADEFQVWYIRAKIGFSIPKAFNIGIGLATQPYILTCGADTMYSKKTLETIADAVIDHSTFVMIERADLPETDVDITNWKRLLSIATRRYTLCPGALQCAAKEWFMQVRGYNEIYSGGLGGPDDDMWLRARRDELKIHWLPWETAQALHQWHPVSPMKGALSHLFVLEPEIIQNTDGWGHGYIS